MTLLLTLNITIMAMDNSTDPISHEKNNGIEFLSSNLHQAPYYEELGIALLKLPTTTKKARVEKIIKGNKMLSKNHKKIAIENLLNPENDNQSEQTPQYAQLFQPFLRKPRSLKKIETNIIFEKLALLEKNPKNVDKICSYCDYDLIDIQPRTKKGQKIKSHLLLHLCDDDQERYCQIISNYVDPYKEGNIYLKKKGLVQLNLAIKQSHPCYKIAICNLLNPEITNNN